MRPPAPAIALASTEAGERTRRQIAVRLLPFLFLLYVTNFVDRTSIAFAALGMSSDLGLSDRTFGLAAGMFFLGYIALQVPGAILVERCRNSATNCLASSNEARHIPIRSSWTPPVSISICPRDWLLPTTASPLPPGPDE